MTDSAIGSAAGYLFQFEKALLALAKLENKTDSVSIENVDDIAVEDENGVILITYQAKHSILTTGGTFTDTSKALWRTIEIWTEKIKKGIFNSETSFICTTNKEILTNSLLFAMASRPFTEVVILIEALLAAQKLKKGSNPAPSISETIKLIEKALANKTELEVLLKNLKIEDKAEIKADFLSELHLESEYHTQTFKDAVYHEFYGWMATGSLEKWRNAKNATFTKQLFNDKLYRILSNSSFVNAVFRKKEMLGSLDSTLLNEKNTELFVQQLQDIKRNKEAKDRLIQSAIADFIYSDIEITHIITKGEYTEQDFEKFINNCKDSWQECFDNHVLNEIDEYGEEERNSIAVTIYSKIMSNIEIKFNEHFGFNTDNRYVRNGCFLKLSNVPEIGWRPDWIEKYRNK